MYTHDCSKKLFHLFIILTNFYKILSEFTWDTRIYEFYSEYWTIFSSIFIKWNVFRDKTTDLSLFTILEHNNNNLWWLVKHNEMHISK